MTPKKLIEVSLPLEEINKESAREKSIRHYHPSTLHLWWARRPLAAARAVIWASLVDDPSAHPDKFATEEEQKAERERLFGILKNLVSWNNSTNQNVLNEAKKEIMQSTNNNPPALLDPFAGGGSIPLEAQRLGLEVHAHDLNPVAVMINKAMIEIPPKFALRAPVNPEAKKRYDKLKYKLNATGLAEDILAYGSWVLNKAYKKIGHLYPKAKAINEKGIIDATVIAYIWARTIKCPNPVCGCEMPLVRSFNLSRHTYIEPVCDNKQIIYKIKKGDKPKIDSTVNKKGAVCCCCHAPVDFSYIRSEAKAGRMNSQLIAIVAKGVGQRIYLPADNEQAKAAILPMPDDMPITSLPDKALGFRVQAYGMTEHYKLFTNRQLTALTTFSKLVGEVQKKVEADAIKAGLLNDNIPLSKGGTGARAYGEAISVYLAFVVDKVADYNSSICSWHNSGEKMRNTFARQAIPMVWDFAESNPFSNLSGSFANMLIWVYKCVSVLPASKCAEVSQADAQSDCGLNNIMISTDPPYYDNIGYADLSDFFYVWLRQSLKNICPKLFGTMLVPKAEELVASPFRFKGGDKEAKEFFENGMFLTCRQLYKYAREDIPVTIYYAYKQSETDADKANQSGGAQRASTGWETMLSAIIKAGFAITGTWPMRTEMQNRSVASGTNALASSVVLVCRKRPSDALSTSHRNFVEELRAELKAALKELQRANIAPVDMAQSAIGPGMAVFSRYARVLEADGTRMSVKTALQIINKELDKYFNEQDSVLDASSLFCLSLYRQSAFKSIKYGEADTLARAKNISVESLKNAGVLRAQKGVVCLLTREEIKDTISVSEPVWLLCQQLVSALEKGGIELCAKIINHFIDTKPQHAKDLAYRLYTIAERQNWPKDAYAYNSLVAAWPDIKNKAEELKNELTNLKTQNLPLT